MSKTFWLATLLVVGFLHSATITHADFVLPDMGLYNTGVDSSGNKLAFHQESHGITAKRVDSGPSPFNVYTTKQLGQGAAWLLDNASNASTWVTDQAFLGSTSTDDPLSTVPQATVWEFTWNVDNSLPANQQLVVDGRWASDNDAEIFLNGFSTGIERKRTGTAPNYVKTFDSWANFQITGFTPGQNVLMIRLNNSPAGDTTPQSAMGLRVEFTSATAVPEPSSLLLCGGLAACGVFQRRKRIER